MEHFPGRGSACEGFDEAVINLLDMGLLEGTPPDHLGITQKGLDFLRPIAEMIIDESEDRNG